MGPSLFNSQATAPTHLPTDSLGSFNMNTPVKMKYVRLTTFEPFCIFLTWQWALIETNLFSVILDQCHKRFELLSPLIRRRIFSSPQSPIQWVSEALYPGLKRPRRKAGQSPPANVKFRKTWIYASIFPLYHRGILLN
jgi:hypothetical protein